MRNAAILLTALLAGVPAAASAAPGVDLEHLRIHVELPNAKRWNVRPETRADAETIAYRDAFIARFVFDAGADCSTEDEAKARCAETFVGSVRVELQVARPAEAEEADDLRGALHAIAAAIEARDATEERVELPVSGLRIRVPKARWEISEEPLDAQIANRVEGDKSVDVLARRRQDDSIGVSLKIWRPTHGCGALVPAMPTKWKRRLQWPAGWEAGTVSTGDARGEIGCGETDRRGASVRVAVIAFFPPEAREVDRRFAAAALEQLSREAEISYFRASPANQPQNVPRDPGLSFIRLYAGPQATRLRNQSGNLIGGRAGFDIFAGSPVLGGIAASLSTAEQRLGFDVHLGLGGGASGGPLQFTLLAIGGVDQTGRRTDPGAVPFGGYGGGEGIACLAIRSIELRLQGLAAARSGTEPEFRGALLVGPRRTGVRAGIEASKTEGASTLGFLLVFSSPPDDLSGR